MHEMSRWDYLNATKKHEGIFLLDQFTYNLHSGSQSLAVWTSEVTPDDSDGTSTPAFREVSNVIQKTLWSISQTVHKCIMDAQRSAS